MVVAQAIVALVASLRRNPSNPLAIARNGEVNIVATSAHCYANAKQNANHNNDSHGPSNNTSH